MMNNSFDISNKNIHFSRAHNYFNDSAYKDALSEINLAITQAPDLIEYRLLRAKIYLEMHKSKLAIEELNFIINRNEKLAEANFTLGCVYDFLKQREQARNHFSLAIEHDPDMIEAYERSALASYFLEDYKSSIQNLNIVLEHQPMNGIAYINRGRSFFRLGNKLCAMENFSQGLYYRFYMPAMILWSLSDSRILAELEQILSQYPQSADTYFVLGHTHETGTKKQIHEAIRNYSRAIELCSEKPVFHLYRSRAYLKQNNSDAAMQDIQHVLQEDPNHIEGILLRGNIYFHQNRTQQAVADFTKVLELNPHHMDAKEIRKRIVESS